MEKCLYCKTETENEICSKCKIVEKVLENGGNSRESRIQKATEHANNNPGLLRQMYLDSGNS